jgi:hypothetical protein
MKRVLHPRKPLGVKVLYQAAELARGIGLSHEALMHLLTARDIYIYRIGRNVFIPLSEIREKLQPIWDSMVATERRDRDVD